MADNETAEVTLGPQGRLVVPARLRRRLGIVPGDVLLVRATEDSLVLERRDGILARTRRRFAGIPADVSLVDELIQHRREESRRERRT